MMTGRGVTHPESEQRRWYTSSRRSSDESKID